MSVYGGPEVVDSGLVLALDAGNTRSYPGSGTTWTDLSGNGNTATLVNSPNFNFLNNGSFSFNGSNTYCTIPSASNLLTFGTTDFSISFWIYLNSTAVNHTILTNYNAYNSGFNTYFFIGYWSARSEINMLHAAGNYTAGATVTANTWSHICFTKTGTTFNVYLNGSLANTTTSASNDYSGTGRTILIGGGLADFGYLNGNLAGLHINRGTALTAAQVAQNYSATVGRYSNLPFSPSDISGLRLWLDASEPKSLFSDTAGTTLATADGTAVALWKDKSGNLNHASQATAGNRPVVKLAVQNNLNVMRFDGSNDFIQPSSFAVGPQPVTVFTVFKTNGTGYHNIYDTSTVNPMMWIDGSGNIELDISGYRSSSVLNSNTLLTYVNASSGGGLRLNGTTAASSYNVSLSSSATSFFNRFGGQTYKGDFYEMLIYNSALTLNQQQLVEAYLNTKWKIY